MLAGLKVTTVEDHLPEVLTNAEYLVTTGHTETPHSNETKTLQSGSYLDQELFQSSTTPVTAMELKLGEVKE